MIIVLSKNIKLDSHIINFACNGDSLVVDTCIDVTCENHTTISIVNVTYITNDAQLNDTVIVTNQL